jgi:hypothetical protein
MPGLGYRWLGPAPLLSASRYAKTPPFRVTLDTL